MVKPYRLPDSLKKFAQAEHMATIDAELLRKGAQYMLASTLDAARSAGVFPTGLKFWRNAPFWW